MPRPTLFTARATMRHADVRAAPFSALATLAAA
jgi:hypothetical protein